MTRWSDLRSKEIGTFSMPSGDSSAAAVFCFLIAHELGLKGIWLLMPLVMMGRVYYHCHWVGDTLVGLLVGSFWGLVGAGQFDNLVTFFRLLVGRDSFIPIHGSPP